MMSWTVRSPNLIPIRIDEVVDYQRRFDQQELDLISLGHRPADMDDKWMVFQEGNSIYCHRSWTGQCSYRLILEGARIKKTVTNGDRETQLAMSMEEHRGILDFIFDTLLLGRPSAPVYQDGAQNHAAVGAVDLAVRPAPLKDFSIELSDRYLQDVSAELLCYGAKDTGEMGGGAAAALLRACGPQLENWQKLALSVLDRQIGCVAFTAPGDLAPKVQGIAHIVSIIKHTPQGSWCPNPERLSGGVERALNFARNVGWRTVALSALGTGEGRVEFEEAAHLMLQGWRAYRQEHRDWPLQVIFALPNENDYQAFAKVKRQYL